MASDYDRLSGKYATRPSPIAGSSRGDPYYDRDRHVSYPPPSEPDYEDERLIPRRDDRPYYPQEYAGLPPLRESRGEILTATSWPQHPPVYPSHSSPPPPPVSAQYNRYYQEPGATSSPHWGERTRWGNPLEDQYFESTVTWRNARRDPPYRHLASSTLLTTTPPSPRSAEYRRRESVPVDPPRPPLREYGRPYPPNHQLYDDRRPISYERPSVPEVPALIPNDTYRQPHVARAPPNYWENPTYRPEIIPATRVNRPSAIRDYKRPLQEPSIQSPRSPSNGAPYWRGEQAFATSVHSRQASLQSVSSVGAGDRGRNAVGPSQSVLRNARAGFTPSVFPTTTKASRYVWEASSEEPEFSEDEPTGGLGHTAETVKQTLHDATRSRDTFGVGSEHKGSESRTASNYPASSASDNFDGTASSRPSQSHGEKPHPPVIRRAWEPSTDRFVPILDNNAEMPRYAERIPGSTAPINARNYLGQSDSVSYRPVTYDQNGSIARRANDAYSRGKENIPSSNVQESGSQRQSVMSVHNLVSPTAVRPQARTSSQEVSVPTPSLLDDDNMQVDVSIRRDAYAPYSSTTIRSSPHRSAADQLSQPQEISFDRDGLSVPRDESVPRLERQRSPSDEPSNIGYSHIATPATPEIYTPEPDADQTLAEVEVQIAETTISSPKPSDSLQPGERLSADGTLRILAPRPKAEKKDIMEMLRKAIIVRRTYDLQSREQRVNPILMDNLTKSDGPEQITRSVEDNFVEKIANRILSETEEEHQMNIRAALATKLAEERELLAEKQQRLRDEYLTLHKRWIAHCAKLDSLFKANDMQESLTQAGRTTRRSASALGDAVRSDLEMEQIIASLGNEDLTDPNHLAVRNVATIPDMISVVKGKVDYLFNDTNNEVDDPANFYDPRSGFYDWTPEEEAIFYAKYAEYPKQFGIIAEFLPHKTSHQCVLYYYIHKKRLIDFRKAVNAGSGKRRKGIRKSGKQKGNALLADVAQADSRRPPGRGRRGRGGFHGRGRGGGPPPSTESGDGDPPAKRRRAMDTPNDLEDAQSVDTDHTRETSVLPPKKRRGRKPGPKPLIASESPGQSPAPGETGSTVGSESTGRRKPGSTSTYWSESDREIFMRLLAQYGKDFKRISMALPNKTHVQVGNYYKNHNRELGLERIALSAANRMRSPGQDRFVTVTRAEASQSREPIEEEVTADQVVDRQIADATSGVGFLTLEQNGKPGQSVLRTSTSSRGATRESVIKVVNPDTYQAFGSSRSRGVIMTPDGQSADYTLEVVQQPAGPHGSSMTSMMNLQHPSAETEGSGPPQDIGTRPREQAVVDRQLHNKVVGLTSALPGGSPDKIQATSPSQTPGVPPSRNYMRPLVHLRRVPSQGQGASDGPTDSFK